MPHGGLQQDLSDPRDLERHNEEVRLLYVGMTRAKEQLHLLHARERALRGGMQRCSATVSPFLKSIPGHNSNSRQSSFERSKGSYGHPSYNGYRQFSNSPRQQSVPPKTHRPPAEETRSAVNAPVTPAQARAARRRR